jgi:ubiquinone/menaquinone biosynthesis C-methylase UbiE
MNNRKQETKNYFNSIASEWDAREVNEKRLQKALSLFPIKPDSIILDIGCGTGVLLPYIKPLTGTHGAIYCMDIAHQMLVQAKRKHRNNNIQFITGDGEELPVRDSFFNSIICLASFAHLKNKETAANEFFRTLQPQGDLSIIHLMGSKELNEVHKNAGAPVKHDHLPPHEALHDMLSSAGFHSVNIVDEPELFFTHAVK